VKFPPIIISDPKEAIAKIVEPTLGTDSFQLPSPVELNSITANEFPA